MNLDAQPLAQPGRLAAGAGAPYARRRLAWFVSRHICPRIGRLISKERFISFQPLSQSCRGIVRITRFMKTIRRREHTLIWTKTVLSQAKQFASQFTSSRRMCIPTVSGRGASYRCRKVPELSAL